ncbi:MAG: hypothetical protein WCQ32_00290 [bacterium]
MKFIIQVLAHTIENIIFFLPIICISLKYEDLINVLICELVLIYGLPITDKLINYKRDYPDYERVIANNLGVTLAFLGNLFIATLLCLGKYKIIKGYQYYIPGFIDDFFSNKDIALKLVSIVLAWVLTYLAYRKAKEEEY